MNRIATLALLMLLFLPAATLGQSRSRKSTKSSKPAPATSTSTPQSYVIRTEGATRIANQIKNLTQFLYLLGGIAKGMEDLDREAKSGQTSPALQQQNEKNKATLRQSFGDFRVGLDQLEIYFRSTPELQGYYVKLVGSASGAADAEAQAAAGNFTQGGRTLIGVVGRLADTLVAMH
jgi:hypothetical protein